MAQHAPLAEDRTASGGTASGRTASGGTEAPGHGAPQDAPAPVGADASAEGRPPRSTVTRAAILAAARDRFAAEGYERATIRSIAREAGIDPSMVMRYYGNKAGLFAAASEIELYVPDLTHVPHEELGARLVGYFLERWESDETLTGMMRVGVTNEAGAERMRGVFAEQIGPAIAAVCPSPEEAEVRSALIASQILGMALCRYVLHFPPAVDLGCDEIVAWLAPTIQRYLTGELP
ncbi:TetR family transcriptional regulator [Streptomyces sp. NPDC056411]|uniref:TetR/AcrR family transcriptional regulator n=1 Tax=Streptomyces sp. NPDC056411 TaxID=3345813 RepID=UPI0035E0EEDE